MDETAQLARRSKKAPPVSESNLTPRDSQAVDKNEMTRSVEMKWAGAGRRYVREAQAAEDNKRTQGIPRPSEMTRSRKNFFFFLSLLPLFLSSFSE